MLSLVNARRDIQSALEDLLRNRPGTILLGILSPNPHGPPTLAQPLAGGHFQIDAGPLQHDEIDIGDTGSGALLEKRLVAVA